ncbi:MAG: hypothetical protein IJM43_06310 [Bacteroidaceae bacterium]|nr:hypothetical protein [Bacteroidaceae bacterium]
MKSMTRTQMADHAGVSLRTFNNWLRPLEPQLTQMGYPPGARSIPPHVVRWLCEYFCIDVTTRGKIKTY